MLETLTSSYFFTTASMLNAKQNHGTLVQQYNYYRSHGAPSLAKHVAWCAYINESRPKQRAQWSERYVKACDLIPMKVN